MYFAHKSDEVTGDWRKLHDKEPYNLHSLADVVRIIKSSKKGCAAHMGR
jgi:hypothetical protein